MRKNNHLVKFIATTVVAFFAIGVSAQVINPVKWKFSLNKISQTESELVFTATIDEGWHLYSQDLPEGGPIPTSFTYAKGLGYFAEGKPLEPKAIEVYDKQFDMKVRYFSGKVEFKQKVKVMSAKPVEIKGVIEYMCCDDEKCLPPTETEFKFTLPPSK